MSQDDDGPPLLDILGSDAVRDVVGGKARHAEGVTSLDGNLGQGRGHADGFEGKLEIKLN